MTKENDKLSNIGSSSDPKNVYGRLQKLLLFCTNNAYDWTLGDSPIDPGSLPGPT